MLQIDATAKEDYQPGVDRAKVQTATHMQESMT